MQQSGVTSCCRVTGEDTTCEDTTCGLVEPNSSYREEWERFRPDGGHVVGVTGTTHALYLCSYYE
jgi:hypothetical protein